MKKTKKNHDPIESYDEAPAEINAEMERSKIIRDLLPPPHLLVLKKIKKVKVTMDFEENDILFFKDNARRLGVSYQSMIRELLRNYVLVSKARSRK